MQDTSQLIRITSWNVAGKAPEFEMSNFLFDDQSRHPSNLRPDVHIVGLQEAPQYIFSDPWTNNLSNTLKGRGYVLFKRHKLSGILLYIFVLREMLLRTRDFETESVKTGFGGLLGNKGAVSLRFNLNGNSVCAVNSHLAAHQEKLDQRIEDQQRIWQNVRFRLDPYTPNMRTHDYTFWFGDLNFRLDNIEKDLVMDSIKEALEAKTLAEKEKRWAKLLEHDQLNSVMKNGRAFSGFEESEPKFPPTFKFVIGSKDTYNSEMRIPAWTDRILFRNYSNPYGLSANYDSKIEQLYYDSIRDTNLSDHKPVVSMFRIKTFDPKVHNPSSVPYEAIKFEPIVGWRAGQDGRLWYKISNELFYRPNEVLSPWDHLRLYRVDFASLEDYLTIVFANNQARVGPSFDAQEVPYYSTWGSRSSSRRSSVSSTSSRVSEAAEATSLNDTTPIVTPLTATPTVISTASLPNDAVIGDGYKYFTAVFPDEALIPGKYVVLYLKTTGANEYNVYGISDSFEIMAA